MNDILTGSTAIKSNLHRADDKGSVPLSLPLCLCVSVLVGGILSLDSIEGQGQGLLPKVFQMHTLEVVLSQM